MVQKAGEKGAAVADLQPTIPKSDRLLAYLLIVPTVLLTACASPPAVTQAGIGSLQLRQPLAIEAGRASVHLQYGRPVASNAVQEHDPFCVFEVESVLPLAQTVAPGRFEIIAITHSVSSIAELSDDPFAWRTRRVRNDEDMPTHIYYKTTFRLSNLTRETNPQVRTLTCMSNQNTPGSHVFMRHLTPAEIRDALGGGFTLNLQSRV
jgi:hypothetical protein